VRIASRNIPELACIACFRPALVMNVRKGRSYRYVWKGRAEPEISVL